MKNDRPFQIIVAEPFDDAAVTRLKEFGNVSLLEDSGPETLLAAMSEADALLVRSKTHVTSRIIEAAPSLRVIGRASPTIDHIDLRAAKRRNISVVYAPHAAVASTAEFTLALILTMQRRIPFLNRQIREGQYDALRKPIGREMARETIGLLGLDPVGAKLAGICKQAFSSRIICWNPGGAAPGEFPGEMVELDELLAQADILSVHLGSSSETRHFLNADRIARMKTTALIINTSRGATIDTAALATALKDRVVAGAALDVFEGEPLPASHPLRRAPNCVLTPHVGGLTLDANAGRFHVAEDVIRVLSGERPLYPLELPE
jgi:D-3-phosphoglycerate dehydrogenase / 2-oxoglutarate reductase